GVSRLHPLLHENVSDLRGQRFRSRFAEAITAWDCLEMARAAAVRALGVDDATPLSLYDVAWFDTPRAGDVLDVSLWEDGDGVVGFSIARHDDAETLVVSGGVDTHAPELDDAEAFDQVRGRSPLQNPDAERDDEWLVGVEGGWDAVRGALVAFAQPEAIVSTTLRSAWPETAWIRGYRHGGTWCLDIYDGGGVPCARIDGLDTVSVGHVGLRQHDEVSSWRPGAAWIKRVGATRDVEDQSTLVTDSGPGKPRLRLDRPAGERAAFGEPVLARPRIALSSISSTSRQAGEVRLDDVAEGVVVLRLSTDDEKISSALADAWDEGMALVATREDIRVLVITSGTAGWT
ncbi:hypothetical protein KCV01_g25439, partial [Aureobasidium melanogenum]